MSGKGAIGGDYITQKHRVAKVYYSIVPLLCLSIKIGAAPSDATVSTRKRQLCLQGRTTAGNEKCHIIFCICLKLSTCWLFEGSLFADVSDAIYWVAEAG